MISEPCIGVKDAITSEDQVPPEWQQYIAKNAAYYQGKQR